ncbi:GNAT family N-acetyltransferase [Shewanella marina]|uniref:GNAT family N-acetyltransferase n=1 Tax=Shewanella marina TaxID=487319 RepID=UPI001F326D20|nr:GNAT family N-acetyltransferase [Shewanella marina]
MQTLQQIDDCSMTTVTPSNLPQLLNLSLAPSQQGFIETISDCLAEAKQDPRFVPVALYYQQELAGFAMFGEFFEPLQRVWFDRFLIDISFQGQGLGKRFATLVMTYLYQHYHVSEVYLSVYNDNPHAIRLYQQLGFEFTGEVDQNGELVMCCAR